VAAITWQGDQQGPGDVTVHAGRLQAAAMPVVAHHRLTPGKRDQASRGADEFPRYLCWLPDGQAVSLEWRGGLYVVAVPRGR
jgi:hypothetical protein